MKRNTPKPERGEEQAKRSALRPTHGAGFVYGIPISLAMWALIAALFALIRAAVQT